MGRLNPGNWKQTLRTNAVRRGLIGGSVFWQAMLVALWLAKFVGKVAKRGEKPVRFSQALRVGEVMEIRHLRPHGETSHDSA